MRTSDYHRLVEGGSRKLGAGDLFVGGEVRCDNGLPKIPGVDQRGSGTPPMTEDVVANYGKS